MKLIYPAVFKPFTDQSGGYVVEFPDLPGCVTEGKDLEQAIEMGIDADAYEEKYGEKAVRKNLTIPAWLNTFAEKNNINFSKLLQDTLFSMAQLK